MTADKPVGWGIVGVAWVSTEFIVQAIAASPASRVVACATRNPDAPYG